jgi:hypothetical protein
MRYLGQIYQRLQKDVELTADEKQELYVKGNFKHLRNIIEREILLRSAKHAINGHLKTQS